MDGNEKNKNIDAIGPPTIKSSTNIESTGSENSQRFSATILPGSGVNTTQAAQAERGLKSGRSTIINAPTTIPQPNVILDGPPATRDSSIEVTSQMIEQMAAQSCATPVAPPNSATTSGHLASLLDRFATMHKESMDLQREILAAIVTFNDNDTSADSPVFIAPSNPPTAKRKLIEEDDSAAPASSRVKLEPTREEFVIASPREDPMRNHRRGRGRRRRGGGQAQPIDNNTKMAISGHVFGRPKDRIRLLSGAWDPLREVPRHETKVGRRQLLQDDLEMTLATDYCKNNRELKARDIRHYTKEDCGNCGERHPEATCPVNFCGTCSSRGHRSSKYPKSQKVCTCSHHPGHLLKECKERCLYEPCNRAHSAINCPKRCCKCGSFQHSGRDCKEVIHCGCGRGIHFAQKHGGGCMTKGCGLYFCHLHCDTCGLSPALHPAGRCTASVVQDFVNPVAGDFNTDPSIRGTIRTLKCLHHEGTYNFGECCLSCDRELKSRELQKLIDIATDAENLAVMEQQMYDGWESRVMVLNGIGDEAREKLLRRLDEEREREQKYLESIQ
ncbi:uncharacterized protein LY89DRAFT_789549 [Mollisia scopiformis]|uniref:Uncharacterized protein n=1 Tax=Mollisia scopiformis TaxID=149040 RepID=A0A132B674_MOLSC|nr:uncharacterized protein LY89DRAFT_789549 [Mollisia scopiformis]KUJ07902.1 hypothetical protein LY89DRAFT_789549 [Mollisia scopiformis]